MPTAQFDTTVIARENSDTEKQAIANCSRYLAYSDQTDMFGYHANIEEVEMSGRTVTFKWSAPVAGTKELKSLDREMDFLSRVESHECLTNPVNRKV